MLYDVVNMTNFIWCFSSKSSIENIVLCFKYERYSNLFYIICALLEVGENKLT